MDQVGCVYTAQGFEFDYAGVIWGPDLVRCGETCFGEPSASYDRPVKTRADARFTDCVKNTYRVLMTRGLRGRYACIPDRETREYVLSRMNLVAAEAAPELTLRDAGDGRVACQRLGHSSRGSGWPSRGAIRAGCRPSTGLRVTAIYWPRRTGVASYF